MIDYEWIILQSAESEADECSHCEFKGYCHQECMEIVEGRPITEVYPNLFRKE